MSLPGINSPPLLCLIYYAIRQEESSDTCGKMAYLLRKMRRQRTTEAAVQHELFVAKRYGAARALAAVPAYSTGSAPYSCDYVPGRYLSNIVHDDISALDSTYLI